MTTAAWVAGLSLRARVLAAGGTGPLLDLPAPTAFLVNGEAAEALQRNNLVWIHGGVFLWKDGALRAAPEAPAWMEGTTAPPVLAHRVGSRLLPAPRGRRT